MTLFSFLPSEKPVKDYEFAQILKRSICLEQNTQAWCENCEKYQPTVSLGAEHERVAFRELRGGVGEGCECPMPRAELGAVSPLVSGEPPERMQEIPFLAWPASRRGAGYSLGCWGCAALEHGLWVMQIPAETPGAGGNPQEPSAPVVTQPLGMREPAPCLGFPYLTARSPAGQRGGGAVGESEEEGRGLGCPKSCCEPLRGSQCCPASISRSLCRFRPGISAACQTSWSLTVR